MPESASTPSRHRLVRAVARALRRRCGVRGPARLVVAVSGGGDSVALLRALALLAGRRGWPLELAVGHVQHHLRGQASEGDAAFVEALAARLDLPLLRADLDPIPPGSNIEAVARRRRYDALATMAEAFNARYVATAHHADDQLETLLMRQLRGTGVAGLRGIAWRRRLESSKSQVSGFKLGDALAASSTRNLKLETRNLSVIRPMLAATRAEAMDFLTLLEQDWREDHTNADVTRLRARLRHEVLPALRAIRADAPHKAVALADHARQVHRLIESEVDRHHERIPPDPVTGQRTLDRSEARLLPRVVLAALLRRLLIEAGTPPDRLTGRTLAPILRAINDRHGGERTFPLADGVRLTVTRSEVVVGRAGG